MKGKKRHQALMPFTEDHNEVLVFSERIGTGLRENVDRKRMKKYANWFKDEYLDPHFELENQFIFPILGKSNVRIKRALANHRRLNRLFDESSNLDIVLNKIEEEIGSFIRFEERILYNEIQKIASKEDLLMIENVHHELDFSEEAWEDRFWLNLSFPISPKKPKDRGINQSLQEINKNTEMLGGVLARKMEDKKNKES